MLIPERSVRMKTARRLREFDQIFRCLTRKLIFGSKMSLTLACAEFFDTHLTRRIEWNSPELGISLQNSKLTYCASEFPTDAADDDDDDDGGDAPTTLPSGQTPSP